MLIVIVIIILIMVIFCYSACVISSRCDKLEDKE